MSAAPCLPGEGGGSPPALRRLQLAAQTGGAVALLFRSAAAPGEHSPATLRLRRPSRNGAEVTLLKQRGGRAGAVLDLLRDRLERLRLPAPVRAVALEASDIRPLLTGSLDLFPGLDRAGTPVPGLLDRLRARLGEEAMRGLALVADHRPERAWRSREARWRRHKPTDRVPG